MPNLQVARLRVARCGTAVSSSLGDFTCIAPSPPLSQLAANAQSALQANNPRYAHFRSVTSLPKPPLRTAASATVQQSSVNLSLPRGRIEKERRKLVIGFVRTLLESRCRWTKVFTKT